MDIIVFKQLESRSIRKSRKNNHCIGCSKPTDT